MQTTPQLPNAQLIDPAKLSREAQHVLNLAGADALRQLVVKQGASAEARDILESLTIDNVLANRPADRTMAHLVVCGLWLLHDALDDAHLICQRYEEGHGAPDAAFWHAHLHRREGDFSNGKYWYRRAGNHPALAALAQYALPVVNSAPADKQLFKITARGFDTSSFVDLCEAVDRNDSSPLRDAAVALQKLEWQVLMAHTIRAA
jgi:hypothetical protein